MTRELTSRPGQCRPKATAIGALIAAGLLSIAEAPGSANADPLPIMAEPVSPVTDDAAEVDFGRLVWRGGLKLQSKHMGFGGLSGLLVSPDGSRLIAVSDAGASVSFPLIHDAAGSLVGAGDGTILPLRDPDGALLKGKAESDAESLGRLADGSIVVAFEHRHRLWRYPAAPEPLAGKPRPFPPPPGLDDLDSNSGIEALTDLDGGAVLAISEGRKQDSESPAFLWRDGRWSTLTFAHAAGFRPTGATRLPGGDVLVIERRFNVIEGLCVRLVRVPKAMIQPDARLEGEALASLEYPVTLDNMEGVAAVRGAGGKTLIYLLSDDNFSGMQRTLLLQFELRG